MHSFHELLEQFELFFSKHKFPNSPATLYEPCSYLLHMGGKRVRPVLCLMGHELFTPLNDNSWNTATAVELFHNFTLMHDDIMDNAPLRRGLATVHEKYNISTAILSGDVMSIYAYQHLNKVDTSYIHAVMALFNQTAIQICEGQQLDMDFEKRDIVSLEEYLEMIRLKTSVLLGTSIKLGAMLGGATEGCSEILSQFGNSLGIAFQLRDDYLDTFGDTNKTGKQIGGDILANKKTYLLAKAFEIIDANQKIILQELLKRKDHEKIQDIIAFFNSIQLKNYIEEEIENYSQKAYFFLEKTPVISSRKKNLLEVTDMLLHREK
jgi:geranylgeranyl diphosphate synthase type II